MVKGSSRRGLGDGVKGSRKRPAAILHFWWMTHVVLLLMYPLKLLYDSASSNINFGQIFLWFKMNECLTIGIL